MVYIRRTYMVCALLRSQVTWIVERSSLLCNRDGISLIQAKLPSSVGIEQLLIGYDYVTTPAKYRCMELGGV